MQVIFDIECDGLKPTKIHCLSWKVVGDSKVRSTTDYSKMKRVLLAAQMLIGHNIIRFDIPILGRLLNIEIKAKLTDTLILSWYLYPRRYLHGLGEWGEVFGVPKPKIDNWDNLDVQEYIHRCEEDVKINSRLWEKQNNLLSLMYNSLQKSKLIGYLSFKMDCARQQEHDMWKLDKEKCETGLNILNGEKIIKVLALTKAMPKITKTVERTKPSKMFKKDGTPSIASFKWDVLLKDMGLDKDYDDVVKQVISVNDGNPNSHIQIKDWLHSIGWQPKTFKYQRNKASGEIRKIPQINVDGGDVCSSIKMLFDKESSLRLLEGLGILSHRISILKGFLDNVDNNDYIQAQIDGITNTLRFKHKTVVNLPKVGKYYGDVIRGCLKAPDGYELCGSDQSSLEDRLKQHYIYSYDPDYVNEMSSDDYDPHLSLAVLANAITLEQMEAYKDGSDKSIKPIRDIFKSGNYACQYGAGPPRLALTANISLTKATEVHTAYWNKNKAIKQVSADQTVKKFEDETWLLNPINGFWYSLRNEKDIFSTLVQGSASYVFDLWVRNFRKERKQLTAQFHDEVVLCIKIGFRERCVNMLTEAIDITNKQLSLNRNLGIDIQFGNNYAEIH